MSSFFQCSEFYNLEYTIWKDGKADFVRGFVRNWIYYWKWKKSKVLGSEANWRAVLKNWHKHEWHSFVLHDYTIQNFVRRKRRPWIDPWRNLAFGLYFLSCFFSLILFTSRMFNPNVYFLLNCFKKVQFNWNQSFVSSQYDRKCT